VKVAILQSNYVPWRGYFDIISRVDRFIFHDDLQYTKNDWRNRNRIKTAGGLRWLTIPCGTNEKRLICDVRLDDPSWQQRHWSLIESSYRDAPFFDDYASYFRDVYLNRRWTNLSELNQHLIVTITRDLLGFRHVEFDDSRRYGLRHTKALRVLELLTKCGATQYVSGPAARSYLTEELFEEANISLEWMDYSMLPAYSQRHGAFEQRVSIVGFLMEAGAKFFRQTTGTTRPIEREAAVA
jgi:hypothetical protein